MKESISTDPSVMPVTIFTANNAMLDNPKEYNTSKRGKMATNFAHIVKYIFKGENISVPHKILFYGYIFIKV